MQQFAGRSQYPKEIQTSMQSADLKEKDRLNVQQREVMSLRAQVETL